VLLAGLAPVDKAAAADAAAAGEHLAVDMASGRAEDEVDAAQPDSTVLAPPPPDAGCRRPRPRGPPRRGRRRPDRCSLAPLVPHPLARCASRANRTRHCRFSAMASLCWNGLVKPSARFFSRGRGRVEPKVRRWGGLSRRGRLLRGARLGWWRPGSGVFLTCRRTVGRWTATLCFAGRDRRSCMRRELPLTVFASLWLGARRLAGDLSCSGGAPTRQKGHGHPFVTDDTGVAWAGGGLSRPAGGRP